MNKIGTIFLILFLLGCQANNNIIGDASQWTTPIGLSTIIVIDSPENIKKLGERNGIQNMYAYSFKMKEQCYVVVPPLTNQFSFDLLKHELRHCSEGRWH